MKLYSFLLCFFLLLASSAMSQQEHRFPISIDWKEMHELRANDEVQKRLFFEGANYIDEHLLPYYTYTIPITNKASSTYTISLDKLVFASCQADEVEVLAQMEEFLQDNIRIEYFISYEKKQPALEIIFTPIIQQNDAFLKVLQAELVVVATSSTKEVSHGKRSLGSGDEALHQYVSSSVLASGNWVQIFVGMVVS